MCERVLGFLEWIRFHYCGSTYNNIRSLFVLTVKETEKVLNVIALDDLDFQALRFNKTVYFYKLPKRQPALICYDSWFCSAALKIFLRGSKQNEWAFALMKHGSKLTRCFTMHMQTTITTTKKRVKNCDSHLICCNIVYEHSQTNWNHFHESKEFVLRKLFPRNNVKRNVKNSAFQWVYLGFCSAAKVWTKIRVYSFFIMR